MDVAGMVLLLLHALDCAHMAPDIAAGVASCALSAGRVGHLGKAGALLACIISFLWLCVVPRYDHIFTVEFVWPEPLRHVLKP